MVTTNLFRPLSGMDNSRLTWQQLRYDKVKQGEMTFQQFLDEAGKIAKLDLRVLKIARYFQKLDEKQNQKQQGCNQKPLQRNSQNLTNHSLDLSPDLAQAPPIAAAIKSSCTLLLG